MPSPRYTRPVRTTYHPPTSTSRTSSSSSSTTRHSSTRKPLTIYSRVEHSWPSIEKALDTGDKLASITEMGMKLKELLPHHETPPADSTQTSNNLKTVQMAEQPHYHEHHSSMFLELDLKTLPTAPKLIHLIEMVGGRERAFVAQIIVKEEVPLDDIVTDEQVLEDVNANELHLHDGI